tara:strand:- start:48 stop:401 length:354 start_codon:yes stop_codon:yes gene_type:complete
MNNGISIEFASHTTPLPSSTWKSISEEERIAKVKSAIKDFPGKETIEIKQAHFDGQVTIVLNNVMTANERGLFLLDLEEWIKKMLDNGITIWHEPIGDKNSLRNLRGIEVVSTEEIL